MFNRCCLFLGLFFLCPYIRAQDTAAMADMFNERAWSFYYKQPDSVVAFGRQALEYAESAKYRKGRVVALSRLARGYMDKGEQEQAKSYCLQAMEAARQAGLPRYEANARLQLALMDLREVRFSAAFDQAQKALALYESAGDKSGMAMAHMRIGQVFSQNKQFKQAIETFETGLRLANKAKDTLALGYLCGELATVYKNQTIDNGSQDFSKAILYFNRAANILDELKINEAWITYLTLSNLYAESTADTSRALWYVQKARSIVDQTGDRYGRCQVLIALASRFHQNGRTPEALHALYQAQELAAQEQFTDLSLQIYFQKAQAYLGSPYPDSARYFLKAYGFALENRLRQTSDLEKKLVLAEKENQVLALENKQKRLDLLFQRQHGDLLEQRLAAAQKDAAIISLEQAQQAKLVELKQRESEIREQKLVSERQAAELRAAAAQRNGLLALLAVALAVIVLVWQFLRIRRLRHEQHLKLAFTRQMAELETRTLRAQMNPHFIFNALASIKKFVLTNDTDSAEAYLSKFARLIRLILENSRETLASLQSEIDLLDNYIQLEQLRSGGRFGYTITCSGDLAPDDVEIPSLVLQPYVENAIVHGLNNRTQPGGHLWLRFELAGEILHVCIEDNGVGRDKAQALKSPDQRLRHRSFGLDITRQRLEAFADRFHKTPEVTISDLTDESGQASGTRVDLEIPVGE